MDTDRIFTRAGAAAVSAAAVVSALGALAIGWPILVSVVVLALIAGLIVVEPAQSASS